MYKLIQLLGSSLFLLLAHGAVMAQQSVRPFPQHFKYAEGTIKPNHISQQKMDSSVCFFYNNWKERYVNDDAGEGQYYVWFEKPGNVKCVSEGQGYGMIVVALMAGYDTASQRIYNGLFRYYKLHPSKRSPFLMAWAQTRNFKDVDGTSASDGDMDIAYSLLLADAQWGSKGNINYREEAHSMIAAIRQQEINPETFSVLLSNAVEPGSPDYFDMRSSDFMPAHFKVFGTTTGDTSWDKAVTANYELFSRLQSKYSTDAGLFPDFVRHINRAPAPAEPYYLESKYDGYYNYNACRVPWRIATDFIINGDGRALETVQKINDWIKETTQNNPDNISAGYNLNGEDLKTRNFEAMSFTASFAVAAMVSGNNQAWLNKLWDYITGFNLDQFDYYDNSIKMIAMIILSGNYWTP